MSVLGARLYGTRQFHRYAYGHTYHKRFRSLHSILTAMSVANLAQPLREKAISTCGKIGRCATHCVLPYHLIKIPDAQCNQKKNHKSDRTTYFRGALKSKKPVIPLSISMRCAIIVIHVSAQMKRDYHEVFRTTLCVSVFVCLFLSLVFRTLCHFASGILNSFLYCIVPQILF